MSADSSHNSAMQTVIKDRKLWLCDVCKQETFEDFDEACRHEEECLKSKKVCPISLAGKDAKTVSTTKQQTFFIPKTKSMSEKTRGMKKKNEWGKSVVSILEDNHVITDSSDCGDGEYKKNNSFTEEEKGKHKKKRRSSRLEKKAERRIKETAKQQKLTFPTSFSRDTKGENSMKDMLCHGVSIGRLKQKNIVCNKTEVSNIISENKEGGNGGIPKRKRKQISQAPFSCHQAVEARKSTTPLAAVFHRKSRSLILAEQRTVEFSVKRRMVAEKERERHQKRAEARNSHIAQKPENKDVLHNQARKLFIERFPVPNHINAASSLKDVKSNLHDARMNLQISSKYPSGKHILSIFPLSQLRGPELSVTSDPTASLFLSGILQEAYKICKADYTTSWTEKYKIRRFPKDIAGKWNRKVGNECATFIDSWKMERLRARKRRAEKQELLMLGTTKRRRRKEEIWETSDDESQLPAIVLLTGPTGCGKTSMVYSLAKHCECKVIEMNTTERRDSQHVKNAVEETTLSDSTFDLLTKNITETSPALNYELEDTDDEDREEQEEGSAVPIILFDETNILFDRNGDSGFWPALKTLSKKAKCPIFLTANDFPEIMNTQSIHFQHFQMQLPSPSECIEKIWPILKSEGFQGLNGVCSEKLKRSLLSFTELFQCDMRRILNELELFICTRLYHCNKKPKLFVAPKVLLCNNDAKIGNRSPIISNITPLTTPVDETTLLTIEVSDIHSLDEQFSVYIGDQICHASKLEDEAKILAACPPFNLKNENKEKDTNFRKGCISSLYPIVKIRSNTHSRWLMSGSHVKTRKLSDGSKLSYLFHCNIKYSIENVLSPYEIEKNIIVKKAKELVFCEDNIESRKGKCLMKTTKKQDRTKKRDSKQPLRIVHMLELASDLHYIEESFVIDGLPLLAGASCGFGSIFVDKDIVHEPSASAHKLSRTENKPPSIERVILSGWNDEECFFGNADAYATNPRPGERRKLSYLATYKDESIIAPFTQQIIGDKKINSSTGDDIINGQLAYPLEDAFILRVSPLTMLPDLFRHSLPDFVHICTVKEKLLSPRRNAHVNILRECVCRLWNDSDLSNSFILRILMRRSKCSMSFQESNLERQFHMDYGPLIENICVSERASLSQTSSMSNTHQQLARRFTRSAKKGARSHYFSQGKSYTPTFFEEDCLEIRQLAALWLEY